MKVAIHSIIKDVYEPYLAEWLCHHRSIGIDHFFLYDNDSVVPLRDLAPKYIHESHLTITPIHDKPSLTNNVQMKSYNDFLSNIQSGSLPYFDRVAFIDEDEFIICENKDIVDTGSIRDLSLFDELNRHCVESI